MMLRFKLILIIILFFKIAVAQNTDSTKYGIFKMEKSLKYYPVILLYSSPIKYGYDPIYYDSLTESPPKYKLGLQKFYDNLESIIIANTSIQILKEQFKQDASVTIFIYFDDMGNITKVNFSEKAIIDVKIKNAIVNEIKSEKDWIPAKKNNQFIASFIGIIVDFRIMYNKEIKESYIK